MLATNDMPVVTWFFTHRAVLQAVHDGQVRTSESTQRKDNWGLVNLDPVEDARRQTIGVLGEMAVSEYFQQEYTFTVNTFKAPDLYVKNVGIQVKASEWAKALIIRPDAKNHEPYVLVRVNIPMGDPRTWSVEDMPEDIVTTSAEIMGWLTPYEARLLADSDPSIIRDPNGRKSPAIFIHPEWLHHIWMLDDWLAGEDVCRSIPQEYRRAD